MCQQNSKTMTDGIAIKKDITVEAKNILKIAMQANCVEYYKRKYITERVEYWTSLGYSHEVATKKANEDYEWTN
mgnify:FL=1